MGKDNIRDIPLSKSIEFYCEFVLSSDCGQERRPESPMFDGLMKQLQIVIIRFLRGAFYDYVSSLDQLIFMRALDV